MKSRLTAHLSSQESLKVAEFFRRSWSLKSTAIFTCMMLETKADFFKVRYFAMVSFLHEEYPELMLQFAYRNQSRRRDMKAKREQTGIDAMRELILKEKKDDGHPDLT